MWSTLLWFPIARIEFNCLRTSKETLTEVMLGEPMFSPNRRQTSHILSIPLNCVLFAGSDFMLLKSVGFIDPILFTNSQSSTMNLFRQCPILLTSFVASTRLFDNGHRCSICRCGCNTNVSWNNGVEYLFTQVPSYLRDYSIAKFCLLIHRHCNSKQLEIWIDSTLDELN